MKIWEEILQRLRNGEPLEEIRMDYRSASQFAKALRIYLDELSEETEEKREVRSQEEEKLKGSKAELKRIRDEKEPLKKGIESLREEKAALLAETQSARDM